MQIHKKQPNKVYRWKSIKKKKVGIPFEAGFVNILAWDQSQQIVESPLRTEN